LYGLVEVIGREGSYGHGIIIGHCVFWGKAVGNGHFRKRWGVDALYGLVECASVGKLWARHYHRALCVLEEQWGVDVSGGSSGEWAF
jgi:hypothetical protein